jgi:hypothetical protein
MFVPFPIRGPDSVDVIGTMLQRIFLCAGLALVQMTVGHFRVNIKRV